MGHCPNYIPLKFVIDQPHCMDTEKCLDFPVYFIFIFLSGGMHTFIFQDSAF